MGIRNFGVYLDHGDVSEINLTDRVIGVHLTDGRRVGQWYDNPGRAVVSLQVDDGFISPDNSLIYVGRGVTLRGGSPAFDIWTGFVSHFEFHPDEQGDVVQVAMFTFSVDELIARGLESSAENVFTIHPTLEPAISLPASDFPNPSGVGTTDRHIFLADRDKDRVYAWNRETQTRESGDDFALNLSGNEAPAGVAFDGEDTVWIADTTSGKVVPFDLTVAGTSTRHMKILELGVESTDGPLPNPHMSGSVNLPAGATAVSVKLTSLHRRVVGQITGGRLPPGPDDIQLTQFQNQSIDTSLGVAGIDSNGNIGVNVAARALTLPVTYSRRGFSIPSGTADTRGWSTGGDIYGRYFNVDIYYVFAFRATATVSYTTTTIGTPTAITNRDFAVTGTGYTALAGVGYSTDTVLACYSDSPTIRGFNPANGSRKSSEDIDGSDAATGFIDVAVGPDHVYALSADNRIHVFRDGNYLGDIEYFRDLNLTVLGIRISGDRLYVLVGGATKRIEVYRLDRAASTFAPRQTSTDRVESLVLDLLGRSIESTDGGVVLPARHWTGSVRDAIRRAADSEYGRFLDGRLFKRGEKRANGAGVDLVITGEMLTRRERESNEDSWVLNTVQLRDYQDAEITVSDNVSVQIRGTKPRSIQTDLSHSQASLTAQLFIDNWKDSIDILEVRVDGLFESDVVASRILGAAPHTLVTFGTPRLVLHRDIRIKPKAGVLSAEATLLLVDPALWGISVPTEVTFRRLLEDGSTRLLEDGDSRLLEDDPRVEVMFRRLLEDGDNRLLEDGSVRELEHV